MKRSKHIEFGLFFWGHSVNVSKNKMAYEVILAYYLHMPLLLAFFSYFLT